MFSILLYGLDLLGLPGSFQAALHGVLTAKEFDQAIRDTMVCGGCTCSRSSFIGACLGAQVPRTLNNTSFLLLTTDFANSYLPKKMLSFPF